MIFKRIGAGILVLALSACTTAYKGPHPNFNLAGEAREQEIQKFKLIEGFWYQAPDTFAMNTMEDRYFESSLRPIMAEVSPRSQLRVRKARIWNRIGQGAFLFAMVILIAELTDDDKYFSDEQSLAYFGALGISITGSFVNAHQLNRAAREYNEDLRAKFSPTVTLNYNY